MQFNKIAIVAITQNGVETAITIQKVLKQADYPCIVYTPEEYGQNETTPMDKSMDAFFKDIYPKVDAIVAVMATGIAIRMVAPLLKGKLVDPAVVSVDASGKFVVSLLCGHYGGANFLTRMIAQGLDALPVITTASDVMGKQSVDELARQLHLKVMNPQSLVPVNLALVNGERLVLVLVGDVKIPGNLINDYKVECAENNEQAIRIVEKYAAGAIITKRFDTLLNIRHVTILKPKKIIIGIGARKNVTEDQVTQAVKTALAQVNLPLECVSGLATVDIKKESQSMANAAQKLGFNLDFVSLDAIRSFKHEELSPKSKVVEKNFGVSGICEQVALRLVDEKAKLILKKIKYKNNVTVAIAEEE